MASSRSTRTRITTPKRASASTRAGGGRSRVSSEPAAEPTDGDFNATLAILTAVMLLVGFFVLDLQLGKHYGEGLLFKSSFSAPK